MTTDDLVELMLKAAMWLIVPPVLFILTVCVWTIMFAFFVEVVLK